MKRFSPFVVYTSSRLVLFVLTAVVLGLLGMHGVLLLLVALVVSGLLSYVLLTKQRDAMSVAVVTRAAGRVSADGQVRPPGRFATLRNRLEARTTAEDYDDEPVDEPAPAEPAAESRAEPAAESRAEPAAESPAEPAAESRAEPAAESPVDERVRPKSPDEPVS